MRQLSLSEADEALLQRAREAALLAYCPYSHFPVGAAVETDIGIFVGCNVENASYGLSLCAERAALFSAIASGARRIHRLAVSCVAADAAGPLAGRMPCGACRQVMAEFMAEETLVLIDGVGLCRMQELFPQAFQLDQRPFLDADRNTIAVETARIDI